MRYKIVAIRDNAVDAFGQPNFVLNTGAAIRSFGDEIKRKDASESNMLAKHPEDFDLYVLGEFDDQVGEFMTNRPERIACGRDYKE